ncbi:D-2-hydroxyacid dehydrogenase [Rhodococcus opacus]|uniref:D-2-hydroxyacid dehydrogenase n=1 Tax=Rhodococcus TaxID=1827 RepID=UPI0002A2FBEC|nr:D-2-hydroxyacid dehydrogenase [Rhodococcus opacus]ELB91428.1 phosphoglycerate dehydrogenase [Rhodococcus wratislaviensis IFP 2016]NHU44574.1 D-2-hydroxyacid dehydrogenase [Rhodococcus sp. A14]MDV6242648.1 D-2-hydroxyacid dehydrogenase [Rhodococcus opacus]MDX5969329.1 D-2-hydroxyacid dehydrogenase [Rhodococcus opacus]NKY75053.1 D-2-hydroxyacid dehydrogenase [Rhodococcus opacus]
MTVPDPCVDVLVASYLEQDLVDRIADSDPRVRVSYAPDLLPRPRWHSDHVGVPRDLTAVEHDRWSSMLRTADVMFDFDWRHPERTLEQSPNLRWIQATSAGAGQLIEKFGLSRAPLTVTTAAGVHAEPLAEFALAGILHFARGLPRLIADRQTRTWRKQETTELAGRHALIVGAGKIGSRTAELLRCFSVTASGVARTPRPAGAPFDSMTTTDRIAEHLPAADILVISCALTDDTRGLIGRRELAALPDGALVVNLGRGPIIDEDALAEALSTGRLGGAVLDVTTTEPLRDDSPLWTADNVILSPHSAANVPSENAKIVDLFVENLGRYLSGDATLINEFDFDAGY